MRAWLLLPLVQLSLRFSGLRSTQRRLRLLFGARVAGAAALTPGRIERCVARAARLHFWEIRCLARSVLAAAWSPGLELRIGVRLEEDLEAHAWVEERGEPVGERRGALAGFHPLSLETEATVACREER